ncbi:MAG: hypothetical protein WCI46_14780, partial [Verrucomicrobiota bacterium]
WGRRRGGWERQRDGAEWRSREAATPAEVESVWTDFRGCRSLLAQPPASRWHPSGMAGGVVGRVSERGWRVEM